MNNYKIKVVTEVVIQADSEVNAKIYAVALAKHEPLSELRGKIVTSEIIESAKVPTYE